MENKKYWNVILIGLLGGAIGLQEFYMQRWVLGVLAVLFCWTGIPAAVALIEVLVWLFEGEGTFYQKIENKAKKELLKD